MSKFVLRLPITALILVMTFSFTGCGGGSGGGGGDDEKPTGPRGVWEVRQAIRYDSDWKELDSVEFPDPLEIDDISGEVKEHLYYGFDNKEFREYVKFTFSGIDASEAKTLKDEHGIEENVFWYEVIADDCTIEGNTVSYKDLDIDAMVKMEFEITEKQAIITRTTTPLGSPDHITARGKIVAEWYGSSVSNAQLIPDDE
ncbi:MAG TPA: hypothetical protein VIL66_08140 [Bacillota bacterium]